MAYLVDTNIFIRLASRNDLLRPLALDALRKLRSRNEVLCYTPQIISEFWNVCTRPAAARGGLDLSAEQTERKVRLIERHFVLLPDSLATFQEWRRLVVAHSLLGITVHDAKVVASMNIHGVTNLLTLNDRDFKRYTIINPVNPSTL
ncbi:MAG TPA: type II toxin-antitoxin system VapC family toxin [Pyrinomonadaceae bacterium]|jgi:predicted nucleic acid-binding protein|nr:type II toxin-antitoxin system VapC family toxin [Pyrinomonadaceae bacterium]